MATKKTTPKRPLTTVHAFVGFEGKKPTRNTLDYMVGYGKKGIMELDDLFTGVVEYAPVVVHYRDGRVVRIA